MIENRTSDQVSNFYYAHYNVALLSPILRILIGFGSAPIGAFFRKWFDNGN